MEQEAVNIAAARYPAASEEELRVLSKPVRKLLAEFRKTCIPLQKDILIALKKGEAKIRAKHGASVKQIAALKRGAVGRGSKKKTMEDVAAEYRTQYGEEPPLGTQASVKYRYKLLQTLLRKQTQDAHPTFTVAEVSIFNKGLIELYWYYGMQEPPNDEELDRELKRGADRVATYRAQEEEEE